MKKIAIIMLLCLSGMAAFTQNYTDRVIITKHVAADTVIWFDDWRPKDAWSVSVNYSTINGTTTAYSLIVTNFTDGSYEYFPANGVTFPVTINPTADHYTGQFGTTKSSRSWNGPKIPYKKLGSKITWGNTTTGTVDIVLNQ